MKEPYLKEHLEYEQILQGLCFGDRYNPKTGVTEKCKHRDECLLYQKYKKKETKRQNFIGVDDYVGSMYIKDWRRCKVYKRLKENEK